MLKTKAKGWFGSMLRKKAFFCSVLFACFAAATVYAQTGEDESDPSSDESVGSGTGKKVYILPLEGAIDKALMISWRRAFRRIKKMDIDALIIDMDTPGGELRKTEKIIEMLGWLNSQDVPVYSFVNRHAQSAGAIVSLGCDAIYMGPNSRIGSALPIMMSPGGGAKEMPDDVQEKILSDTRAMVRGLAQQNGYSEKLAQAMVDPEIEYKVGDKMICEKGEILNLTAQEAVQKVPPDNEPLLASAVVEDIDALCAEVGLANAEQVRYETEPAEVLAKYIVSIGPILLSIGVLGIFMEMKTPGFGIPGIAGAVALVIYFFGHYVGALAGFEEIALVVVGLGLILLEVFVIPGFGVAGIPGIIMVVAGLFLGFIPALPDAPPGIPNMEGTGFQAYMTIALLKFVIAMFLVGIGVYVLSKFLPKTTFYRQLVLDTSLTQETGYVSGNEHDKEYVGREGITVTPLRPSGIAMVDEERLDVVSRGDLIAADSRVKVVEVRGRRVIVEKVEEESEEGVGGQNTVPSSG